MTGKRDEGEKGFTVVDRRASAADREAGSEPQRGPEGPPSQPAGARPGDVKLDFSTFVISLGTSALYHMGLVEDPETRQPSEKDLTLARQTIDTIEMLSEKTRGNLDPEESQLVESLLYELRMRFVEAGK